MEPVQFPAAWTWLMDEALPSYIKQQYSPKESWKAKPFSTEDARFFFRGIAELSELFTEDRPKHVPQYFGHARFRSAYLLYFLPLQAAKFLCTFQRHAEAAETALAAGRSRERLKLLDLGSGPGTASFAFLLWLLDRRLEKGEQIPPIELHWHDTNSAILRDGKELALKFCAKFPRLRDRVTVHTHHSEWWQADSSDASLVLLGNVLNESPGSPQILRKLEALKDDCEGGMLFIEPAARRSAQLLSQIRDQLVVREGGALGGSTSPLWGPCLHAGACPLKDGRDWCHFSFPARIPGKWFQEFSKGLGSERQWLKFSYLWVCSPRARAPKTTPSARLVISDPINLRSGGRTVLLCQPETPGRKMLRGNQKLHRGDITSS